MNPEIEARLAMLRGGIDVERREIRELYYKSPALNSHLRDVTAIINLVEGGFFEEDVLSEPRTDAQWQYWLDGATTMLETAIRQRKYLAALLANHGSEITKVL